MHFFLRWSPNKNMNYHSSDPLLLHLFVQPGRVPVLHELAERAPGRGGGVPLSTLLERVPGGGH